MRAEREDDGTWTVDAPWLEQPVRAATWEEAYWMAVKARSGHAVE
jgi:hypothetical protein